MEKFPSIDQFRNVIRELKINHDYQGKDENGEPLYSHSEPYPTILFEGTVKLHGTNAGIVKYPDKIEFQSRERVLTLAQDNAGFMLSLSSKNLDKLFEGIEFNNYVAIYGEWCGQSIQSGVALSQLPKMFVIFGLKVDDVWVPYFESIPEENIFNIQDFPKFQIEVDFNNPELVQNKLIELTENVEKECPVGKHFGVSGIGEGIVWTSFYKDKVYRFKTKGEKHSSSKVKTLASVNVDELNSINEFVDYSLTDSRLNQGISVLKEQGLPINQSSTGEFLRWIIGDIVKEESDTMISNQIDMKKANPVISKEARLWYFNNLEI